jgi:hypothetical protein
MASAKMSAMNATGREIAIFNSIFDGDSPIECGIKWRFIRYRSRPILSNGNNYSSFTKRRNRDRIEFVIFDYYRADIEIRTSKQRSVIGSVVSGFDQPDSRRTTLAASEAYFGDLFR